MKTPSWPVLLLTACLLACGAPRAGSKTLTACPAGAKHRQCEFFGGAGVQKAIDKAQAGDTVLLKSGTYAAQGFRDTPYKKYVVRGFLTIDHKDIRLVGEPDTILDGATGPAVTAVVVNGGRVVIRSLTVRNFRAIDPEDDLYDGSGIYVIDAEAVLSDVVVDNHAKMGIAGRGTALVAATNVRIENGYVGILQAESAYFRLCNSIVRNNRAAGLAAYANSFTAIYNSVFDGNLDDGLFGVAAAQIFAANSLLLNNKPYAVRVTDDARAKVDHSFVFGNEADAFSPPGKNLVTFGEGVRYEKPVDAEGDPDVRGPAGTRPKIGLGDVAACARG